MDRTTLQVVKFEPNWAQLEYLAEIQRQLDEKGRVRIIVLKARQLGISTATEAVMFTWAFLREHMHGMVVAHENDSSEHLLAMHNLFWDRYPFRDLYTPLYMSRKHKAWKETHSSIRVATAKNASAGRSRTIHFLHASEVAFWDRGLRATNAGETMLSLRQAIPTTRGTFIIIESTANGVGNFFYNEWMQAEAGESEYIPIFFPWYRHYEYRASHIGLPYEKLAPYDEEELKLIKDHHVDDDALAWRRWAIRNLTNYDVNLFHQEYPSTPEEAFIATGTNVFPVKKLAACFTPFDPMRGRLATETDGSVRFQPDISGPLSIYRYPSTNKEWGIYMVSGDPTRTMHGDMACAQVFSRRTLEQVAVWEGRIDPSSFGEELVKLAKFYNNALVTTEITGPGYATIGRIMGMDYPFIWRHSKPDMERGNVQSNYGWDSTMQSKAAAIGMMLKVVVDEDVKIHDKRTFAQMRDYVTLEGGGYGPATSSGHDDHVTSFAIGMACHLLDAHSVWAYSGRTTTEPVEPPWVEWQEEASA